MSQNAPNNAAPREETADETVFDAIASENETSPEVRVEASTGALKSYTPRATTRRKRGTALKFPRRFTSADQDVFDTVEWETRTATISGEDGKAVFEQTNCEIPKSWSQLATNVVVSKYFRGPMESPQREYSVRQVIGRVADTIHGWGREGGYFASDEDAKAFRDELAYLLLHQYGSFNSPVWFNIGVKGAKQQASACQPYDALVSTPQGLIPIGRLVEDDAVGTTVYDAKGAARILATKANGVKNVLRIHTKSGYTLDVTADHLVWKATGQSCGQWVEAGTLRANDKLLWCRTPVVDKTQELDGEVAEAALAGWLQSDGFVGQYESGTNRSLTIEAMTVRPEEEAWVRAAMAQVLAGVHSHTREVITQDETLQCRRIRVYGEVLRPFIEKWNLLERHAQMQVPAQLFDAPLSTVAAYLRSLFQAEGYVSVRENAVVALDMVPEKLVRGIQSLLGRFGIYARVSFKKDTRENRAGCWSLAIRTLGDRERFAQEIGFISADKTEKLHASLQLSGLRAGERKRLEIERIEVRGEMPVYDIQTSSGEYLSGGLRVHNCFINSVYDDMESIMELAATEARLFKGGSGAGSNLWRIRSSREHLSGGGIASGPVSFMRGWDAFAGAIKSGGTTRRAAKMVILNADHPDISEFIVCKADEEKKAWALIEAGYNGGFNVPGGAYDSVDFQNANHSVRVTDAFMRAAENNMPWTTRAVMTGEPVETKNAKELLMQIAECTHICGDPGLQYDTTINDWHTCANTDRIYASNPCCITGDTLVAVADGRNAVAIRDLVGSEVPVYAHDHANGQTTISRMWNIEAKRHNAPIYRVTLDDGSSFRATDDHLIMQRDGSYRMVRDLKSGDALMPFHSQVLAPAQNRTKRRYYWKGQSWQPQYRAIWEYAHGAQPAAHHIHHRDFDALNDSASNLQPLPAEAHNALHREKMLGDYNPARRLMNEQWRANTSRAMSGENNPHFGHTHGESALQTMREKAAVRWSDPAQRATASENAKKWMANAKSEGRSIGRPRGPRFERCCPVCRSNFETSREAQIFCSLACRHSPLGMQMCGAKTWNANRGRALSADHRAKLSASGRAVADSATKSRAASMAARNAVLRAARLMLDNGQQISLAAWDELRPQMRALGSTRVPTSVTAARHFSDDAQLNEQAALFNHKVVSVEFCGHEDVYDGTVDTHHNFAILTSQNDSCAGNQQNFSGIFIHNSEFVFLDDTACNLASLNLMKYRDAEGIFDAEAFIHASETFITAQEILVSNASYPTEKIAINSEDYRPLGLGYANLGALLMAQGTAYDSDEGRSLAGAITAIMTGAAYAQSARIAANIGPFNGYATNREPMLRVIRKHRDAVGDIRGSQVPPQVLAGAQRVWDSALVLGEKHGYRNAQATVLAPTGTIAFMMDCDTTGIEPDIALVKYKKLVGGGLLKIVNQTVPAALQKLGYSGEETQEIVDYIDQNDTIEGAPHLRDEDLSIFDCAFKAMNGTRSIHYLGHIKMMGAAQPFLSGAISKTVNLPAECSVQDVFDAYLESWKQCLKAVAIYRDGSKRTQPLSTASDATKAQNAADAKAAAHVLRRKLPDERAAITHKFSIAGQEGYFTVGLFEDGAPGEIFIKMNKEGSTISGLMDSFAVAISMALQYGVPLKVLVNKFMHTRFEPSGYTTNKEIPIAKSLMDYIFRWFDLKFQPNGDDNAPKSEPSLLDAKDDDKGGEAKKA